MLLASSASGPFLPGRILDVVPGIVSSSAVGVTFVISNFSSFGSREWSSLNRDNVFTGLGWVGTL